jgi:phytoene synthase
VRGRDADRASRRADALGVALQLTNILRDVREDFRAGRVYLPAADLDRFGCTVRELPDGTLDAHGGAFAELVRFESARAADWYTRGLALLPMLDRRSAACCAAMAGIYHELLQRIAADPGGVMRGRMSLPARDKLRVAGRSLVRGRRAHA